MRDKLSEKLTDPNKAAHEVIEVLEDGDAIRNDGVRLQAANKNPWYVLATIYGEQEDIGSVRIADQNRNTWNAWYEATVSPQQRRDMIKAFRARFNDGTALPPDRVRQIKFSNTYFPNGLDCNDFEFKNTVLFDSSVFEGAANFVDARFKGNACFQDVEFKREANFNFATFEAPSIGGANFKNARFWDGAFFHSTVFNEDADFQAAEFRCEAEFSSAQFKASTNFTKARFVTEVPKFHATTFYEDTVFTLPDKFRKNWPPLRGEGVMEASEQKRAYNRLRLFMNKSLQIEEEQFFHRMEMRCKAVLAKWRHKPLYWLFAAFSDYGNSVWRPIVWGALSVIAAAVFMLWWQGVFAFTPQEAGMDWTFGLFADGDVWAKPREAFGWSISNALPFIGTGSLYFGGDFANELAWPLRVVGGVQTLFGFILLFLFGLGLRNRFRLR